MSKVEVLMRYISLLLLHVCISIATPILHACEVAKAAIEDLAHVNQKDDLSIDDADQKYAQPFEQAIRAFDIEKAEKLYLDLVKDAKCKTIGGKSNFFENQMAIEQSQIADLKEKKRTHDLDTTVGIEQTISQEPPVGPLRDHALALYVQKERKYLREEEIAREKIAQKKERLTSIWHNKGASLMLSKQMNKLKKREKRL